MPQDEGVTGVTADSQTKPEDSADQGGKGKGEDKNPLEDRVAQLEKEAADKDKRIGELTESERYHFERSRQLAEAQDADDEPENKADEDQPIEDSADQTVDAFSTEGIVALVKRGLLTKKDAREIIVKEARRAAEEVVGVESRKLRTDAELVQKYPELNDSKSELFKRTGAIFREMVADDRDLSKSPQALLLAARAAKAELAAETSTASRDESEADRRKRIAAQAGGAGARGAGFNGDEDDEKLSPAQKKLIARFNAEGGVQITEEAYAKRVKDGVRMSVRSAIPEKKREVGDWS